MFRLPAGLGCLVALLAVPLAILAALVAMVRAVLSPARRSTRPAGAPRARPFGARGLSGTDADIELCEFVRKMSLDDSFDVDDARTAGLPVSPGITLESMLQRGLAHGWLERRGTGYAVTARGRSESEQLLRRRGL